MFLAKNKSKRLNLIKQKAQKLHKNTFLAPDTVKAINVYNEILAEYPGATIESLPDSVTEDIHFLTALGTISENLIKQFPSLETEEVKFYSGIIGISNDLKKNDYQMFIDYIKKSRNAENIVQSKTFKGSKDLVELNIILVDSFTKDTLTNDTKTIYTAGWKTRGLSFSTGFFYTEMLSDKPYFLLARPDESMLVLPGRQLAWDVSIGGLGHFYWKVSPCTRIGPSVGISISPFDGKSRYLLGGSVLLGREKMVGINIGWAFAKVKELSSVVLMDEEGMYLPKGSTAVPTIDRINNSFYFGLTYNLASTRK